MLETVVAILAVGLLLVVLAGGLFTVIVGLGSAIADSLRTRLAHGGHPGQAAHTH